MKVPKFFFWAVLALISVSPTLKLYSQPQEIKDAIEVISKISSGGADRTTYLLIESGFEVPETLKSEWEHLSAYRKIETAYWMAEQNKNGQKFLALLSAKLAREFESVPYEYSLKPLLKLTIHADDKMIFGQLNTIKLPGMVPDDVASSIISIVKYTDNKALGGTRGILRYYFGLSEGRATEILRQSATNFDALLIGINEASIPPTQKERVSNILQELKSSIESASFDEQITRLMGEKNVAKERPGTKLRKNPPIQKIKKNYDEFVKRNHETNESKKFPEMRKNSRGFGGIIFGNKLSFQTLPTLLRLTWIHDKKSNNPCGNLEFAFIDSSRKVIPNVLWEDAYAAYELCFSKSENFIVKKNGIGLTGASYPEILSEDKVYDSIIKSNHMTLSELKYYNFRNEIKKNYSAFENRLTQDISILKGLKLDLLYDDSLFNSELELTKTYIQLGMNNAAVSHRRAAKQAHLNYKSDSAQFSETRAKYFSDTLVVSNYEKKVASRFEEWKKNDSTAKKKVDSYIAKTNKIILHPAIANLELGRSLIRADVMPRDSGMMVSKLSACNINNSQRTIVKNWLKGTDTLGWKFTDDSLEIFSNNDLIQVKRRTDVTKTGDGLLIFNTINYDNKGNTISLDFNDFPIINPILNNCIYDYKRVNDFAKIMAIFRWAKQSKSKFLNKPSVPPMIIAPSYIAISEDGAINLVDMR